ncbi:MAG: nucleotidyltransferase [Rubrivivax sp.]|jgi:hypothetical protein|nr:nucleotidyltransferase [Rubrivivax sp.]
MLHRDFREFVSFLNAQSVEFLLVGGWALAAHGRPRATGDIDFWIRRTPENIQRLLLAISDFGFGSLRLDASHFGADSVVQFGRPPLRIDLLTSLSGVEFDACWSRRVSVVFGDIELQVIGVDDLKINKLATGREQDQLDVKQLEHGRKR